MLLFEFSRACRLNDAISCHAGIQTKFIKLQGHRIKLSNEMTKQRWWKKFPFLKSAFKWKKHVSNHISNLSRKPLWLYPLVACTSMCHCSIQELSTLHSTCTTDTQLAIHSTSSYIDNLTIIFFHLLFLFKKLTIFLPFNGEPIHKKTLSISLSTVISA